MLSWSSGCTVLRRRPRGGSTASGTVRKPIYSAPPCNEQGVDRRHALQALDRYPFVDALNALAGGPVASRRALSVEVKELHVGRCREGDC